MNLHQLTVSESAQCWQQLNGSIIDIISVHFVTSTYVTVLEKRNHLATNIIFGLCILSEGGHCEL